MFVNYFVRSVYPFLPNQRLTGTEDVGYGQKREISTGTKPAGLYSFPLADIPLRYVIRGDGLLNLTHGKEI